MFKDSRVKYQGKLGTVTDILLEDEHVLVVATLDNGDTVKDLGSKFSVDYFTAKS